MVMRIRGLLSEDDLSSFCCDLPSVDSWFRACAHAYQGRFGSTYVMADDDGGIVGAIAIATSTVRRPSGETCGYPNWPVLLIGQLGVQLSYKGRGFGQQLVEFALRRAVDLSELSGAEWVIVDAHPTVVAFYEKHGFLPLGIPKPDGHLKMFVGLPAVREMLAVADC